jgi:hypothetical protein
LFESRCHWLLFQHSLVAYLGFCRRDVADRLQQPAPPPDSKSAIEELRDIREDDVRYLAVAWPAFWWFQYYKEWSEYLRKTARCVLSNERTSLRKLRGYTS